VVSWTLESGKLVIMSEKYEIKEKRSVIVEKTLTITAEWSCSWCAEYGEYTWSVPFDLHTALECPKCNEDNLIIDEEFMNTAYPDLLKKAGISYE